MYLDLKQIPTHAPERAGVVLSIGLSVESLALHCVLCVCESTGTSRCGLGWLDHPNCAFISIAG